MTISKENGLFWLKMAIFDTKWVIWNDLFCKYAHFQGIKGRQPSNRFWKWFLKFLEKSMPTENEKCIFRVYFRVKMHYWCTALMWKIVKMPIADWLPYPPPLYINIGFFCSKILIFLDFPDSSRNQPMTKIGWIRPFLVQSYLFRKMVESHPSPHISKFLTFWRDKSSITNDLFDQ